MYILNLISLLKVRRKFDASDIRPNIIIMYLLMQSADY